MSYVLKKIFFSYILHKCRLTDCISASIVYVGCHLSYIHLTFHPSPSRVLQPSVSIDKTRFMLKNNGMHIPEWLRKASKTIFIGCEYMFTAVWIYIHSTVNIYPQPMNTEHTRPSCLSMSVYMMYAVCRMYVRKMTYYIHYTCRYTVG